MDDTLSVLVVGAGPVGLTAATELTRRGVPVRLIDKADGASPLTKALVVWPRTLEVLRHLGGAEAIRSYGLPLHSFQYYSFAKPICTIEFEAATKPAVIIQPDVERMLAESLAAAGGKIEWNTTLIDVTQDSGGVDVTLEGPVGTRSTERFAYVIGADGASSAVRKEIGQEFVGATYENVFILADTAVDGDIQRDAVHYFISDRGILVMVPLYNGRFRAFTAGPPGMRPEDLTQEVLQDFIDTRGPGGLRLYDTDWKTTFSIHARHSEKFRVGRVILAGDAAHVHSPAGGQGLNTGVTDAHNLAWKLALVLRGQASADLLDTYETERGVVARAVVAQAQGQTKAWLLKKAWQARTRDVTARLAERLNLYNRYYAPWLAGLTNGYPDSLAVTAAQTRRLPRLRTGIGSGHLVPNLPIAESGGAATTGLREALATDRYTLLVTGDAWRSGAAVKALQSAYPDLLDVRYLSASGELTAEPGGPARPELASGRFRGSSVALVRPDHYVAVTDRRAGLVAIGAHLAALTRVRQPALT